MDDIGQQTTCEAWGDATGTETLDPNNEYPEIQNIPPIIDDGPSHIIYDTGSAIIYYRGYVLNFKIFIIWIEIICSC